MLCIYYHTITHKINLGIFLKTIDFLLRISEMYGSEFYLNKTVKKLKKIRNYLFYNNNTTYYKWR